MNDNDLITRAELRTILEDVARQVNEGFAAIEQRHYTRAAIDGLVQQVNDGFGNHGAAIAAIGQVAAVNITRGAMGGTDAPTVNLNFEPGAFTVQNDVHPADVVLPARRTSTFVERDDRGLIVETTSVEHDA